MRLLLPDELDRLDAWLAEGRRKFMEQLGAIRTGSGIAIPDDPPKEWKEWWTLRQVLNRKGWQAMFGNSFIAEHANSPDFRLVTSEGLELCLEVTEATTGGDRVAIKRGRVTSEPVALGILGGRGRGGYRGAVPEREVAGDIAAAIRRKSLKRFGGRAALLIYANSNPATVVQPDILIHQISSLPADSYFEFALLIVPELPLIKIDPEGAHWASR